MTFDLVFCSFRYHDEFWQVVKKSFFCKSHDFSLADRDADFVRTFNYQWVVNLSVLICTGSTEVILAEKSTSIP